MNNSPGRGRGHRPPRPRRVRATAIITVMAAAALLAAACSGPSSTGSGGSPNAGGSGSSSPWVAYSRCVRAHGIPDFPDPDSSGNLNKEAIRHLGVSDSLLRAATAACANLNPSNLSPAQQRQQLTDDLKFARCMRSHGLPNFPDPTTDPRSGQVEFVLSTSRLGANPPQILAKARQCQPVLPAGSRLPSATVAP